MRNVPEDWWQLAAEKVPHPLACVSLDGRFVWCNQAFCELVGYSIRELMDLTWPEITATEDVGGDLAGVQQIKDGERSEYYLEKTYIRKDGAAVRVSLLVHRFPEFGQLTCFIAAASAEGEKVNGSDFRSLKQDVEILRVEIHRLKNPWPARYEFVKANWWIISGVGAGVFAVVTWFVSYFFGG